VALERTDQLSVTMQRGFTLIELLVVIAIIGILSAVVLASLSTARSKGSDAAIESDMHTIQNEAEIYYDTLGAYGTNANAVANCTNTRTLFADTGTDGGNSAATAQAALPIENAIAAIKSANSGGTLKCSVGPTSATSYAIQSSLVTNPAEYWCVDSTGFGGMDTSALSGTTCPTS